MYPSDFDTADTAFVPVDQPLFLGLPPLLALVVLLLVLAIAAGMYFLGRWHADQSGGSDIDRAPEDIHRAILNVSLDAMGASSNDLKSRAQTLHDAVRNYIGPVLQVAKGVAGPMKALEEALKGEIKDAHKPGDKDKGHDKDGHADHAHPPHPAVAAGASPITVNQIFVGPVPPPAHPHKDEAHDKPKPAKPETRPMSGPEQIDALSRAVRQFHDHWSDGPERIRELREARRALSRRPPLSALKTPERRVWS
jgi:hypothetical protein